MEKLSDRDRLVAEVNPDLREELSERSSRSDRDRNGTQTNRPKQ
ncbi:hypothetical protein [Oxynema sp. CENA135]|nr:hypothetical protein [Oxynema sp. CENA135]